jgi:glutathione S-transferase
MALTIYGDHRLGNCLKVKWTAERLGIEYDWVETPGGAGATRTRQFLRMNPAAQIPTVVLEDGRSLAQSNAICLHLAEGSELIPKDPYWRAKMLEWLFWEQYSHEPYVAGRRYFKLYEGKTDAELDPEIMVRGEQALARMQAWLGATPYLVPDQLTLADIALVAYTRVAHEGGFDLGKYPAVKSWVGRIEAELGLQPAQSG